MRLSQTGLGTIRVNNLDKSYPAQDILLQTNQLVQYGTGIYAYNNVPLRLRQNVESVIREVLDKYGCIEILLPTLQPTKLWEESGRLAKYIEEDVIMPVETDNGKFVMAPTAEEAVTEFSQCTGFTWSMNYVMCHKKPPYRIKKVCQDFVTVS